MTDKFGRPFARPQTTADADALARKYAEGHLPSGPEFVEQQQKQQFDEIGAMEGDLYWTREERMEEIARRILDNKEGQSAEIPPEFRKYWRD